jgi:hypothetical protein
VISAQNVGVGVYGTHAHDFLLYGSQVSGVETRLLYIYIYTAPILAKQRAELKFIRVRLALRKQCI